MIDKLRTAWETLHPRSFTVMLRKQYPDVYQWVLAQPMAISIDSFADLIYKN